MGQQSNKLNLNEEQKAVYDNIINSLQNDAQLASEYSNRKCNRCTGKGYYSTDRILRTGLATMIDGKPSRTTPPQTNLCECINKKIIREIISIKELHKDAVA